VTLTEFLAAALDEDQRVAEAATPGPWRYNPHKEWHTPPIPLAVQVPGEEYVACGPLESPTCVAATGPAEDGQSMDDAEFIAAHNPTRALAEIAAKRAILELHSGEDGGACNSCGSTEFGWQVKWPCTTTLVVASTFRGRQGWEPAWEVQG
jgi:hypothetical protein